MRLLRNDGADAQPLAGGLRASVSPCPNCNESKRLSLAGSAWMRCGACQFLLPQGAAAFEQHSVSAEAGAAGFGPGILLRERYRLVHLLGQGAHGRTFLAEHEFLGHPCVVKALPYRIVDASDAAVRRLRTEASAGFRVNDGHVVRVLDFDACEGVWYFVMEYVEGLDLSTAVRAGLPIDWRQAVRIATEAATGLAAIHRAGMVHRDIKPSNLILGRDGRVRVADLGVVGLVQTQQQDFQLAGQHEPVGTLGYAAPEIFEEDVREDPRADLYSLGATLYELVTTRSLRPTGSIYQVLLDALPGHAAWPEDAGVEVPDWLVRGILRLLEPDPDDRFASADAFLDFLRQPTGGVTRPQLVVERPEPRGLVVLPLENTDTSDSNDWVGHAVADHLSRALGQLAGAYVVDRNLFQETLARVPRGSGEDRVAHLLRAGRLNGAATIVEGDFSVDGGDVAFRLRMHVAGGLARELRPSRGPLAGLADLENELLGQVATALGLQQGGGQPAATSASAALAAQERFFAGRRAFFRGDYEAARNLGLEAVDLDPEFIEALGFVGVCCARMGRYDEASRYNTQQEELAGQRNDERSRVEAFANRATMHYFRGDYEPAEAALRQAIEIADALGMASEVALINNNLGFVQLQLGLTDKAAGTFARAIETHKTYGALVSLVAPYNGMGNVLREQQRYEEARSYFERALALAQESDDQVNVGVGYMNLGQCALLLGRLGDAKHELARALSILERTTFWNGLARVYEFMADLNLQLGNAAEATRCAERRIELAARHNNLRMEAAAWRQKAGAVRLVGRSDEAAACQARAEEAEARQQRASRSA